ncbi:MAG: hypothetical protein OXI05_04435 [Bacteroidota bacterium]|nr:hypothetical protein [Bacteroidota bacterium]MDE2645069.1 hypothetical protein [Bacteroidota bacterium]MXZ18629.1 hypothetical protein [Rhodothermaceae bacterium]MYG69215.1 hypothetical protein [Rhodothermaceae bacterium]MYJ45652.1 hypothetical protein [Rhodothermaceae bacterium]
MSSEWSSMVAGVLLGLCYAGAHVLVVRIAQNTSSFVPIVIGGMVLRMFAALTVLIIVIQLFPVVLPVFTGTFLLIALIGLFAEVTWLIRKKA